MDTINDRIALVRKELNLTRKAFGEPLGVSDSVIKNIEYNIVSPKPLLLNQICKEYNVDPYWLETGEGEMFMPQTKDDVITNFLAEVLSQEEESIKRRFVEMLAGLDEDGWILLEKTLDTLYPNKPVHHDENRKKEQDL